MSSELDPRRTMHDGIAAVKQEEYLLGLNLLTETYSRTVDPSMSEGLSYLGLCVALVERKFGAAIQLCRKAVETQFYDGAHYRNLSCVYLASGDRRRALEVCEEGLNILPDHEGLLALRKELGIRARPTVPFLARTNPINQALGRVRHSKKEDDAETEEESVESAD